jgi:hypothetical protein
MIDTTEYSYGAPYLQEETESPKTFQNVIDELEKEDADIILDQINDFVQINLKLKKRIKRYFDLKSFPMPLTSDEICEMNNLEKLLR